MLVTVGNYRHYLPSCSAPPLRFCLALAFYDLFFKHGESRKEKTLARLKDTTLHTNLSVEEI